MKKIMIAMGLSLSLLSLFGCHNKIFAQEQPFEAMQQSYKGVLPCADCGGIETSLFLQQDGTYILNEVYQVKPKGNQSYAQYGRWARTADKLVLTEANGEKRYFRPAGDNLEMLDMHGEQIHASSSHPMQHFQLKPAEQRMPQTPMPLSGMVHYQANNVVFTDCATGKVIPVATSSLLEKAYMDARHSPDQLIFVSMDGHFQLEPGGDEGKGHKLLVADSNIIADASKHCK
ncbi:envelope stress response activation lipoprotein NlpE [Serratia sp. M24T3]|uniref:Envelope stress response activation lipoprotein NlpE n=1 Tax=Rouxiella sp. WC2420 TaxID=3234145 RepID=A0AB39VUH3_9GAMM|nr:envelope stress response activation lipoprotein NlpE [Serratia sp. M24T3]EIC83082.1 lipoprotein involved with copper homeostasis and adhesion [Serratia sp. M24T3]